MFIILICADEENERIVVYHRTFSLIFGMEGCFFGWILKILKSPRESRGPLTEMQAAMETLAAHPVWCFWRTSKSQSSVTSACLEQRAVTWPVVNQRKEITVVCLWGVWFFTTFSEIVCLWDKGEKTLMQVNPSSQKRKIIGINMQHTLCFLPCIVLSSFLFYHFRTSSMITFNYNFPNLKPVVENHLRFSLLFYRREFVLISAPKHLFCLCWGRCVFLSFGFPASGISSHLRWHFLQCTSCPSILSLTNHLKYQRELIPIDTPNIITVYARWNEHQQHVLYICTISTNIHRRLQHCKQMHDYAN